MMSKHENLFNRFPFIKRGIRERYFDGYASTDWRDNRDDSGIVVFMGTCSVCNSSEGYRVERNSASRESGRVPAAPSPVIRGNTLAPVRHHPLAAATATTVATHRIYPRGTATANVPLASYFEVGTLTLRCGAHPSRPGGSFPGLLLSTRMR